MEGSHARDKNLGNRYNQLSAFVCTTFIYLFSEAPKPKVNFTSPATPSTSGIGTFSSKKILA